MLARGPHSRATPAVMINPPVRLRGCDQPPEIPGRPAIARRSRSRQQPFRGNPALRRLHFPGDKISNNLVIAFPGRTHRCAPGLETINNAFHRFRCRSRHRGGPSISTHLLIRGNDVHTLPHTLQWNSLGGDRTGFDTNTVHRSGPAAPTRHEDRGGGDFQRPPAKTFTWPPLGTFSWPRTPRRPPRQRDHPERAWRSLRIEMSRSIQAMSSDGSLLGQGFDQVGGCLWGVCARGPT